MLGEGSLMMWWWWWWEGIIRSASIPITHSHNTEHDHRNNTIRDADGTELLHNARIINYFKPLHLHLAQKNGHHPLTRSFINYIFSQVTVANYKSLGELTTWRVPRYQC